ncbi:hypothetical protein BT96DRAFT_84791 [Gymnopus androsaceus JB14]|uniref:Uncharacterized protein n=1 Tax=Gymnopus androsaceus JB14 TaxID=1447944 RepID=A0A6A4IB01_9AGAR|nr:hypothetical protein BT96DRAFT_84791 [Gymnopus androsaceus JB14]
MGAGPTQRSNHLIQMQQQQHHHQIQQNQNQNQHHGHHPGTSGSKVSYTPNASNPATLNPSPNYPTANNQTIPVFGRPTLPAAAPPPMSAPAVLARGSGTSTNFGAFASGSSSSFAGFPSTSSGLGSDQGQRRRASGPAAHPSSLDSSLRRRLSSSTSPVFLHPAPASGPSSSNAASTMFPGIGLGSGPGLHYNPASNSTGNPTHPMLSIHPHVSPTMQSTKAHTTQSLHAQVTSSSSTQTHGSQNSVHPALSHPPAQQATSSILLSAQKSLESTWNSLVACVDKEITTLHSTHAAQIGVWAGFVENVRKDGEQTKEELRQMGEELRLVKGEREEARADTQRTHHELGIVKSELEAVRAERDRSRANANTNTNISPDYDALLASYNTLQSNTAKLQTSHTALVTSHSSLQQSHRLLTNTHQELQDAQSKALLRLSIAEDALKEAREEVGRCEDRRRKEKGVLKERVGMLEGMLAKVNNAQGGERGQGKGREIIEIQDEEENREQERRLTQKHTRPDPQVAFRIRVRAPLSYWH